MITTATGHQALNHEIIAQAARAKCATSLAAPIPFACHNG